MVKHVVTTDMVPHLWAQQNPEQEWAKSGHGSISYRGKELISYSTVIARFVEDINGETVVLIADNRWGPTTGGQISAAQHATTQYTQFSGLSHVGQYGAPDHQKNLDVMIYEYRTDIDKQKRAFSYWRTGPYETVNTARDYARRFGLEMPVIDEAAEWAEVMAIQAAREARRNTPQAIAKREKDAERRAAKRTTEQQRKAEERAARYAEELERRTNWNRDRPERERIAVAAFRDGGSMSYDARDAKGGALIRVVDRTGDRLETSLGATVPLTQAIRVFELARRIRGSERGCDIRPPMKVGDFTVSRIHNDGTIRAGCHTIHWPEIERLAVRLGLIEGWSIPSEPRMEAA